MNGSMVDDNVSALLLLARQGDESARGALLENYRNYLSLLARMEIGRQLGSRLESTDVVQETFLEAHRNLHLFRGAREREFVAWLRSILAAKVANLVRHHLGTQGRDVRREHTLDLNIDHSSQLLDRGLFALGSSPSQHVARREMGLVLAEALAHLPQDYREVVVLRHFEELAFMDVALRMGRSVDSVQKLWVRALGQLRQAMRNVE